MIPITFSIRFGPHSGSLVYAMVLAVPQKGDVFSFEGYQGVSGLFTVGYVTHILSPTGPEIRVTLEA
jgi:hypothetical protein